MRGISPRGFQDALIEGITSIKLVHPSKSYRIIHDDLGFEIGRNGGSCIDYWRYGDPKTPPKLDEVEKLGSAIVKRSNVGREWLIRFLRCAGHPYPESIGDDHFPDVDTDEGTVGQQLDMLRELTKEARSTQSEMRRLEFIKYLWDTLMLLEGVRTSGDKASNEAETVASDKSMQLSPTNANSSPTEKFARTIKSSIKPAPDAISPKLGSWRNHVLWVDDRPYNIFDDWKVFEAIGIRITLALSTDEALDYLAHNKYVAIISDMERGEGPREGYVLLDTIRSRGIDTPFFIYAGFRRPEHLLETVKHEGQGTTSDVAELFQLVLQAVIRQGGVVQYAALDDYLQQPFRPNYRKFLHIRRST